MVTAFQPDVNHGPTIDRLVRDHVDDRLRAWPAARRQALLERAGFVGSRPSLAETAESLAMSRQAAQRLIKNGVDELRPLPDSLRRLVREASRLIQALVPVRWERARTAL